MRSGEPKPTTGEVLWYAFISIILLSVAVYALAGAAMVVMAAIDAYRSMF